MPSYISICLAGLVLALNAHGKYALPEVKRVPIARLLQNLEVQLKTSTRKAEYHHHMARLHAMMYALKVNENEAVDATNAQLTYQDPKTKSVRPLAKMDVAFRMPDSSEVYFKTKPTQDAQVKAKAESHLKKAIEYYELSLKEDPSSATAHIGLGWCVMELGDKARAQTELRAAFNKAYEADKEDNFGKPLTEEVGRYLISVLHPQLHRVEIGRVKERMAEVAEGRAVTPLILPLTDVRTAYSDLLLNDRRVAFDLDGSGVRKSWRWINRQAGWLVYPGGQPVTSGLQMFGSVTFWMFWNHAYQPLRALDDNADGILAGDELTGLAVWHDVNEDGVQAADELHSLSALGIVNVNTRALKGPGGIWFSACGVKLADGRCRPTYDFVSDSRSVH